MMHRQALVLDSANQALSPGVAGNRAPNRPQLHRSAGPQEALAKPGLRRQLVAQMVRKNLQTQAGTKAKPMIDLIALFVLAALLILVFLLLGFILAHFLEFLVFLLALLAILTVLVLLGVIQVTRRI
jgi:Flp pilus assembly protein TadB